MTFNITEDQTVNPEGQATDTQGTQDHAANSTAAMTADQINEIVKRDAHAQQHIKNLESENNGMRESLSSFEKEIEALKAKLASQDIVQQLITGKQQTNSVNVNKDQEVNNNFDSDTINKMVSEQLKDFMRSQEQEKNMSVARTTLHEIFKGKADDHVKEVASKNGMSFDDAMSLAKTNPALFSNVFVNPYKQSASSPAPTSASNNSQLPSATPEINMDYWNKLRRENPIKYYSVDTQKQYHQWFAANRDKLI